MLVACGTTVQGRAQTSPVPASRGAGAPSTLVALTTSLASGMRAATTDAANAHVWVLTRDDVGATVSLTELSPTGETQETVALPRTGKDWLRGAVIVSAGVVWASWGTALIEYHPDQQKIDIHEGDWKDAGDGLVGRSVDMTTDGSDCVTVAVVGDKALHCWNLTLNSWQGVSTGLDTEVGPNTRIATCGGRLTLNLGAAGSRPSIMGGTLWSIPEDSVALAMVNDPNCWLVGPQQYGALAADDAINLVTHHPWSGPVWDTPMTATGRGIAYIQQGMGSVTLEEWDEKTGATTRWAFPVRRLDDITSGIAGSSVSSFADPCIVNLVAPTGATIWAISCLRGDEQQTGAYPAVWAAT